MTEEKPVVLFVFRRGRKERLELCRAGRGPDEMLYGLTRFDQGKFETDFIEDDERRNLPRLAWKLIERQIAKSVNVGFVLPLALGNLGALRRADAIVSTVDACGLPIAMLKYIGLIKTPMVYISQGLAHRLDSMPVRSRARRLAAKTYSRFLRSVERLVVLGDGAAAPLARMLGLPPEDILCLPFGVDVGFWSPAVRQQTDNYILSVGSDPARDYDTLLAALSGQKLKLVTRLEVSTSKADGDVEVGCDYSDVELRELYRQARFVVIPLRDVDQPSGQSAALQAMACGKAVVLTKTKGLWEPDRMRHLDNCYLVDPANVAQLREGMAYLTDRPEEVERIGNNGRRLVNDRYNSGDFARRLQALVQVLVES